MVMLSKVSENSILENIKVRYEKDIIYVSEKLSKSDK